VKLEGKVVVVTGAGSGIGRATALAFAAAGARVAACDVDAARARALARELGGRALCVERVDVADRAQVAGFADAVHARAPAADVIVNNAGVACGGDFVDISLDDWDWLLGVNLRGVVHGCHFFVPRMIERGGGGHVINVSSIFGIFPAPGTTAYVASKFAVLGFSQSLRPELAPHRIGVTAICPGMIATSIIDDGRISGALRERASRIAAAFRRGGAPPDVVARAILEAVQTNPAVRPVGRDAWALWAMTRVAPSAASHIGSLLRRRFGAAG
jgi:NAD(P)-dependent dehydrogenase (short-subunit alcohol dehydrogenase family)